MLSSDKLEHVPDFRAALAETRRVLRPGVRHISAVPVVWTPSATEARARTGDDSEIIHLMPALYHGKGNGAYRFIAVRVGRLADVHRLRPRHRRLRARGGVRARFTRDPMNAPS